MGLKVGRPDTRKQIFKHGAGSRQVGRRPTRRDPVVSPQDQKGPDTLAECQLHLRVNMAFGQYHALLPYTWGVAPGCGNHGLRP